MKAILWSEYGNNKIGICTNVAMFALNPKLESVSFRDLQLIDVSQIESCLVGIKNQLITLDISSNNLTNIRDDDYSIFPNSEVFIFSSNLIATNVTEKTFKNLSKLKIISLNNNKIKYIANNAFSNIPQLYYLSLSRNNLNKIPIEFI